MIYSFDEFLNKKINEAESPQSGSKFRPLLDSIAQAVVANSHRDPMMHYIVSNRKEFEEFLVSSHYVVKAMSPEERQAVASSAQGMAMLIQRMLADYQQRSPHLKQSEIQAGYEKRWGVPKPDPGPGMRTHPAHTPSGRKLLELVIAIYGKDNFKPIADKLVAAFLRNGQAKVDQWASQINTIEEMKARIADWQNRGII